MQHQMYELYDGSSNTHYFKWQGDPACTLTQYMIWTYTMRCMQGLFNI